MTVEKQIKTVVQRIQKEEEPNERRTLFLQVCHRLAEGPAEHVALIKPLLYDWDFEIRKEAAYWISMLEIPLEGTEEYALRYALLQFEWLKCRAREDREARSWLIKGLTDRSLRVREKVLRVFHLSDCENDWERLLYCYARGDYLELLKLARERGKEEEVRKLLREGLDFRRNIPYHQRQCALALQQLGEEVELPGRPRKAKAAPKDPEPVLLPQQKNEDPLTAFLRDLMEQGILTPRGRIFPSIQVGTVTGRITYRNPGLQTYSEEERIKTILPEEGHVLWKFDFCQIEPRLLLHFLVESFWISLQDIPEGDVYAITGISDRSRAKTWLNRLINGGAVPLPENAPRRLLRFREAVENYRMELVEMAQQEGAVETLGGRRIEIDPSDARLPRRVMSFKIQGSAADFFNEAVVALHAHLSLERLPARIVFLLYDEVWVEMRKDAAPSLAKEIETFLNSVARRFQLFVEIPIRAEEIPATGR